MSAELRWAVTSRSGMKRIHRADCRYARNPYVWAGARTERELYDALRDAPSGAARWHDACQLCAPMLDWALRMLREGEATGLRFYVAQLQNEREVAS